MQRMNLTVNMIAIFAVYESLASMSVHISSDAILYSKTGKMTLVRQLLTEDLK